MAPPVAVEAVALVQRGHTRVARRLRQRRAERESSSRHTMAHTLSPVIPVIKVEAIIMPIIGTRGRG